MAKKKSHPRKLNLYSNLSHRVKQGRDVAARRRARYLATLPKHPVKRFFHRLHPKRVWKYWFSRQGAIMALKITGVTILLMVLLVGGLFAYFRKDLDAIRPGEIDKRVQSTVTTYLDRNGEILWNDKGDGNYKLVVEADDLSDNLKHATIAIEDRDFYKHSGVSMSGLARAFFNNLTGGSIQGGSTLTQQLVKQVFFADEAQNRGLGGVPRKIKELILSIEVERMYDKEQILTLYLNESPYGGRRNGAESGAQTYFGKSAKDLTLAEAALLAAIPQNPAIYDPYNIAGHEALIARQHRVLDNMASQGYVTREEADEAKKYPIIDHINPESSQYTDIRAPHFVQMARSELEEELGKATVGRGGLTVTTTLDIRIQDKLEEAVNDMFSSYLPNAAGFSNGAATVEDTQTGQIVALVGSRDFEYPGYGQDNAATAYLQPGSSIKPLVYAELFESKPAGQINYGSGTVLKDENIDSIYGARLQNVDRSFKGDITIRTGLATSRNIPAVKAMYISGVTPTLETIRDLGGSSYCTQGNETQVGLASAIGGCGIRQVDLVNAYASLGREGVYKPLSTVLEVKNHANETLVKWSDPAGKQIIDPQSAYVVTDILHDDAARSPLTGRFPTGMYISGVPTATKTGTSDKDGFAKDIWMVSYSPALTMGVWLGNSDATILNQSSSLIPGPILAKVLEYAHKDIYASQGLWNLNDWYTQPAGIQRIGNEVYPSWWKKSQGQSETKLTFDRVSKKRATACTPPDARIEINVIKMIDPVTKKDIYIAPDGYNGNEEDDAHICGQAQPTVSVSWNAAGNNKYTIVANVNPGVFGITNVQILVGGSVVATIQAPGPYTYTYTRPSSDSSAKSVSAIVIDDGFYKATGSGPTIPAASSPPNNDD